MKKFVLIALSIITQLSAAQVSGYVSDKHTGERLPGAIIYTLDGKMHTQSNQYGYYSIDTKNDSIGCSMPGYVSRHIKIDGVMRYDIELTELHKEITEIVVKSESTFSREMSTPQMGHHKMLSKDIKSLPTMFGEADVLKTIQSMPGVNAAADGSTNLSVRGGSHDQNIIVLDEATVYNPSHALGLFTAFNPDAINSIDFYKSCFPARYGGKLSSVIDMKMKEGNMKKFSMDGGIGTIASRLLIEGPIKKDEASYIVSGRIGYGDGINQVVELFDNQYPHKNDRIRFNDFSVKINWNIDANNHIYASGYASNDDFKCYILSQDNRQQWGNKTATLRWNHSNNTTFVNTTLTYSKYNYSQKQNKDVRNYRWEAEMSEANLKINVDRYGKVHLAYGGGLEFHYFEPGEIVPCDTSSVMLPMSLGDKRMGITYLYSDVQMNLTQKLSVDVGLRVSSTLLNSFYAGAEPRISLSYQATHNAYIKASYSRTMQFQHLLSSSALGLPTDIWMPVNKRIAPQKAQTISVGVHSRIDDANIETSVEGYYKTMTDIIDFKDGAELVLNKNVEEEILNGKALAYGAELLIKHNSKHVNAQISYTISNAKRKIDGVNNNKWYYAVYDQRHNIGTNVTTYIGRNELSLAWGYHTGGRTTIPLRTFVYDGVALSIYSERNGYIMRDFHRLDISLAHNFKKNSNRKFKSQLVFAVYNCYGRKNAYAMFVSQSKYSLDEYSSHVLYLYQWVPSVTYNIKF